jgi:hypothetical protein
MTGGKKTISSWEKIELGKYWSTGSKERFYINNEINRNIEGGSFDLEMSDAYIDLKTGEYGSNRPLTDNDVELLNERIKTILAGMAANYGKDAYSSWTEKTQKCTNIYHFVKGA